MYAAAWERIAADPAVLALADRLRARGLGVHLATNQNPERATYMRRELGYADRFDTQFYSCELGVAKPEAAYFQRVLASVDATADQVLFVDDSARNVAGARDDRAGRRAVAPRRRAAAAARAARGRTAWAEALNRGATRRHRRGWPDWRP